MNINYEAVIMLMLGLIIIDLFMISRLFDIIKNLKSDIEKLHARVNDVYYNTVDINANVGKIMGTTKLINNLVDDIWDKECSGDSVDPDDEDDDEPVCGECNVEEDPIRLITANDFFFRGPNDKFELDYFADRDELRYYYVGAEFIVIDNVKECIGEGLKFFGVNSKDPNVAYVRNNIFGADFRIVKRSADDA